MIAIIGGYGQVGLGTLNLLLSEYGAENIKIGGRYPEKISGETKEQIGNIRLEKVDVYDKGSLKNFIRECDIVINCCGPSHKLSYDIYKIVSECGKKYVDAGFDMRFTVEKSSSAAALYGCGSSPGFSGLAQKYLVSLFDEAENLNYYYGGISKFTKAAAEDYLIGACEEKTGFMANYRNYKKESLTSFESETTELPYFSEDIKIIPFYDDECEETAVSSKIKNASWFIVSEGERVTSLMKNARYEWNKDKEKCIKNFMTSVNLDLIGRKEYMCFLLECDGIKDGSYVKKRMAVKTYQPSYFTGFMTGIAAVYMMKNNVKNGVYTMSEIVDPVFVWNSIQKYNAAHIISISDVKDDSYYDEGEI